MPHDLILPATVMSLAFVFYTTGVWLERFARDLRWHHIALFWVGLACDGTATALMHRLTQAGQEPGIVHTITGVSAFGLMVVHATWATWVWRKGSPEARAGFHRYSIVVWALWLVPYFGGMIAGILKGSNG